MGKPRRPDVSRVNRTIDDASATLMKIRDPNGSIRALDLQVDWSGYAYMDDPKKVRALGEFLLKAADWM